MRKTIFFALLAIVLFSCENDEKQNEQNEQKIILKTNVVDAEYSKKSDQLVYVSSNPHQINIFNTTSETTDNIPLIFEPTCLSLSLDGKTAAVGHNGHITYVNLQSRSIINTYDVSCSALDIVLGNNKWAYVFPKEDQWTYIKSVNMNLSYDNEAPISIYNQIHAGEKGRLHPSGKYIYAQSALSRGTSERFNIENGDISNNYESQFEENDYAYVPSIWFSENGNRLFTRNRSVLKTSEINSLDMIYNGTIDEQNGSNIEWLDHSEIKNNLYLILSTGNQWNQIKSNYIHIYNASNLTFVKKIELEKYIVTTENKQTLYYDAIPFFVFSNSNGNNLYVITKTDESGIINNWAIQKIKIE